MPEANWSRHGLAIGRQEFRRTVRRLRGDKARLALVGFGLLFFGAVTLLGSWLVLRFADELAGAALADSVRASIAVQWGFAVFIFAQRAGTQHDRIDNDSLMLLTVSVRSVVTGLVAAEVGRALAYVALPVVLVGGAFVYATASPVTAPLLVLAVTLSLATAAILGFVLGLTANLLVARVRFVARYKSVLAGVVVLAFFGLYFLAQNALGGEAFALLGLAPVGWFADLALLGSPIGVSVPRAVAALVGSLVWLAVCGAVVERLASALWFGDSVADDIAAERARVDADGVRDPLAAAARPLSFPPVAQPTRRVAERAVVVARRNPSRLSFVILPVVFVGSFLSGAIRDGTLFAYLPVIISLLGPWLAGAAFGLNPYGDEGAVLPATLVSLPSGRQYATGLALPGLLLGLPLTVALTAVTGVLGPFTPAEIVLLAVAGAALAGLSVTLAPAVGTTFPRYDPIRVRRDREIVPPSLSAILLYSLGVALVGGIVVGAAVAPGALRTGLAFVVGVLFPLPFGWLAAQGVTPAVGVATWLTGLGAQVAALPLDVVHWGGYAGGLVIVVLAIPFGVRTVARRFEGYTYE